MNEDNKIPENLRALYLWLTATRQSHKIFSDDWRQIR